MLKQTWEALSDPVGREDLEPYRPLVGTYPKLLAEVLRDSLTTSQRRYILMYYRDGLTMEEIAHTCGLNRSTVSRTIKRARERLKRAIRVELVKKSMHNTQCTMHNY